jgi:8-oxo-dGTP pyrophosphatase MutT (NUDIX family)
VSAPAPDPGEAAVRDAAALILVRDADRGAPRVLMGQRGAGAAFMPMKFVFPGGAVDPADAGVPLAAPLAPGCRARLLADADGPPPEALAACAIRELHEEAGLALARPGVWPRPAPPGWEALAAAGLLPDAGALTFVFRAVTPPGRPRRFDARFFLADAAALAGDPDDFRRAGGELSHLTWVPLAEARRLDLPFITQVVLAEVAARLAGTAEPGVPYFRHRGARSEFVRL